MCRHFNKLCAVPVEFSQWVFMRLNACFFYGCGTHLLVRQITSFKPLFQLDAMACWLLLGPTGGHGVHQIWVMFNPCSATGRPGPAWASARLDLSVSREIRSELCRDSVWKLLLAAQLRKIAWFFLWIFSQVDLPPRKIHRKIHGKIHPSRPDNSPGNPPGNSPENSPENSLENSHKPSQGNPLDHWAWCIIVDEGNICCLAQKHSIASRSVYCSGPQCHQTPA